MSSAGRTLTLRVARIATPTPEVRVVELVHPWGGRLPGYRAGAHIDVHTPGGFSRPYSLARAAPAGGAVDRYVIGVKRESPSRGGSAALHEQLAEGDLLAVGAPRDTFSVQPGPGPHWLLAGGIGLTPLLAMAEQLAAEGREARLVVFARSRAQLPFTAELAALGDRVQLHLDEASAPEKIDLRALLATPPGPQAQLYLCGPAGFMQAARQAASAWGEERIHAEYFAAPEGASDLGRGDPFELRLAQSRLSVPVAAEQSAVEALAELGIAVPTSCEQGLCGTCVVRWQGGEGGAEPLHRDHCLTGAERRQKVALCCSRARGGVLVVDL